MTYDDVKKDLKKCLKAIDRSEIAMLADG